MELRGGFLVFNTFAVFGKLNETKLSIAVLAALLCVCA